VKQSVSQPVVIVLIVVGFLIAGAGGYFLLLGPQRSHAASLDKQIADTQSSIDSARALTLQAKQGAKIRVADIFRLTKAMPDQTDMAGILLELNQVAQDTGITFTQITPATVAVALSGYEAIPITVEFEGNFYELSDLLYRLRNLVDVRHGALDSAGRLFAIDSIDFAEANPPGFPQIKAHLTIDAFVYGIGTAPTVEPAGGATTGTTGATGATGATGTTGTSGATGTTGASGATTTAASAAPAGG
jgi:Pilus assembly protein, PilO